MISTSYTKTARKLSEGSIHLHLATPFSIPCKTSFLTLHSVLIPYPCILDLPNSPQVFETKMSSFSSGALELVENKRSEGIDFIPPAHSSFKTSLSSRDLI